MSDAGEPAGAAQAVGPQDRAGTGMSATAEARSTEACDADALRAWLPHALARQRARVARHDFAGQAVWVKRARAAHPRIVYWALAAVARLAGAPLLAPVPVAAGAAGLQVEARRLHAFAAAGLPAARVRLLTGEALITDDLGAGGPAPSLGDALRSAREAGRGDEVLALWREGLDAIARVHAAGLCLSQAFARNLVRDAQGRWAAIDFEDDPLAVMPLPLAQARDWLAYAHSSALDLLDAGQAGAAQAHWQAHRATLSPAVRIALDDAIAGLAWTGRLPQPASGWRDLRRVHAARGLLAGDWR